MTPFLVVVGALLLFTVLIILGQRDWVRLERQRLARRRARRARGVPAIPDAPSEPRASTTLRGMRRELGGPAQVVVPRGPYALSRRRKTWKPGQR